MAEKPSPPSSPEYEYISPSRYQVTREEWPLSRREGEEVMRQRLSGPAGAQKSKKDSSGERHQRGRSRRKHKQKWHKSVVVTFEYEKQQEDELSLQVGEIVERVEYVSNHWYKGRIGDKEGVFPDNFVKTIYDKSYKTAKVVFSHAAENPDELTLKPGEIVKMVEDAEDGWWKVRIGDKEGLFPSNFVEIIYDPDPEAQQFLQDAMKQGYVHVSIVKVTVIGPAGVGKTCLKYLLLSKTPPTPGQRTSTGCAERPIQVIRVGKEGEEWKEIDEAEFERMIAEAVPILCERLKKCGKGLGGVLNVLSQVGGGEGGGGKTPQDTDSHDCSSDSDSEPETSSDAAIQEVVEKLTGLISDSKQSQQLFDMQWIYFTDSGGQQAFWDLIPIFMYDTSATLFVHRLCDELDKPPLNDLYKDGKRVGPSQKTSLTTAEAFKTMLRGLHVKKNHSKIALVGTHKDMAGSCKETIDQKNEKFAAIISPHFDDDVLCCGNDMSKVIFEVNTIDPKSEDKKAAQEIRKSVEKSARIHEIPIWWYILQMILEKLASKLGRQVLSKQECEEVAGSLGFETDELEAALEFLDKLNLFLYKKDILPDVVFTSAQVPLDKLTELVEERYNLKAAEAGPSKSSDRAREGKWRKFRDQATLTLDHLTEFDLHYKTSDGVFTPKDFLKLLEKVLVIARISETEYFFPSMLDMIPDDQISSFLAAPRERVAVLVVQFPTGWAPPGVYCCAVCHLQSSSHWEILKHKKKRGKSEKVFISRNEIRFTVEGRTGTVTFIDNFASFAICVDASDVEDEDLTEHCHAIRNDVLQAVQTALDNVHHDDISPYIAFLCPRQDETCCTAPHAATVSKNRKKWICAENKQVVGNLTEQQKVWLSRGVVVPSKPTTIDLADHVASEISSKLTELAIQLGLEMTDITRIQIDNRGEFNQLMAVFSHWQQAQKKPYTWNFLVTALKSRSINKVALADKLHRQFCQ